MKWQLTYFAWCCNESLLRFRYCEMSIVLLGRLWAWNVMLISRPLSHSLSVLYSVSVLVMCLWRPCVLFLISESVVEGWAGENTVSLPPSSPLLWWWSAQAPWALCPYLSPREEHLLGIPLRSECWHCCFSVPKAHEYLACVREPRNALQTNHQIKPVRCSADTDEVQDQRPASPGLI